jgi:hypothetical protein
MRAHNVLCNSYNTWPLLCVRITCYVSYNTRPLLCAHITCYVIVITVEINHCSFRHVCFYAYRLYFINVWHVYEWPKTYTWSGTFILKDGRYTFFFSNFIITQTCWMFDGTCCSQPTHLHGHQYQLVRGSEQYWDVGHWNGTMFTSS